MRLAPQSLRDRLLKSSLNLTVHTHVTPLSKEAGQGGVCPILYYLKSKFRRITHNSIFAYYLTVLNLFIPHRSACACAHGVV